MKLKSNYAAPTLLILLSVLLSLSTLLDDRLAGDATTSALSAMVLEAVIFLIPALIFCRLRGASCLPGLRLRPFTARHLVLIVLAAVFMIAGGTALSAALYHWFPEAYAASSPAAGPLYIMDGTLFGTVRTLLAFAVLPAVCEEFVFRGVIVEEYGRYGVGCAVLMSTLSFAMIHFNFVRLPVYLFGGLVLALTLYASRSLWAAVTVHVLYNITVLLTDSYVCRFVSSRQGGGFVLLTFGMVLLALVSGFFFFYEAQKLYRRYGESGIPASYRPAGKAGGSVWVSVLAAPPLLLFIVLYIVLSAIS